MTTIKSDNDDDDRNPWKWRHCELNVENRLEGLEGTPLKPMPQQKQSCRTESETISLQGLLPCLGSAQWDQWPQRRQPDENQEGKLVLSSSRIIYGRLKTRTAEMSPKMSIASIFPRSEPSWSSGQPQQLSWLRQSVTASGQQEESPFTPISRHAKRESAQISGYLQ